MTFKKYKLNFIFGLLYGINYFKILRSVVGMGLLAYSVWVYAQNGSVERLYVDLIGESIIETGTSIEIGFGTDITKIEETK